MMCLIARPRLSIIARMRFLFCNHPVFASFVSRFGDGGFSCRHISIEFHVCGSGIAWGDDLVALVVDADIQSVCIPLGCVQDQAKEALGASDCAPCRGRNILDVQLLVD
jgi:hypothetical protein